MGISLVVFTFTGRMADQHELGPVEYMRYHESARQLVATCGHFYTLGRVPNGAAFSEGRYYGMIKRANEAGSFRDTWKIAIVGGMIGNVLATNVQRGIDYGFDRFMQDGVGSAITGQPVTVPVEWPKESMLEAQDRSNAPFIETEGERHMRWLELRERLNGILPNISRPVGRSADKLAIHVDGKLVGVIDESVMQRLMQPQIMAMQSEITGVLQGMRRHS
jgi:hypothetical protein